jgi:hypothetical protein
MGEPSRHQFDRRGARCQTDGQAGRRGGIGLPEKPIVRRTAGFIQSKDGRTDSPRHCIKMRWRLARRVRLPGLKSAPWLRPGRILCRWHSPLVKGSNGSGAGPVAKRMVFSVVSPVPQDRSAWAQPDPLPGLDEESSEPLGLFLWDRREGIEVDFMRAEETVKSSLLDRLAELV